VSDQRELLAQKQSAHRRAELAWDPADKPEWLDEKAFTKQVQPRLGDLTIATIALALGVSIPYASDIREGRRRPHPRHWLELAKLANLHNIGS
jgi:hypothetical protein